MTASPAAEFPHFDATGRLSWPLHPRDMHCRGAILVRMIRVLANVDWSFGDALRRAALEDEGFTTSQMATLAEPALTLSRHYRGSYAALFPPPSRQIAARIVANAREAGAPTLDGVVTPKNAAQIAHGLVEIVAAVRMLTREKTA